MKKTLYMHIGMGKTGTTALQHFFWINRRRLARLGIAYPEYGSVADAHHLLSPHIPPYLKDAWKFRSVDEWAPKLTKLKQDTILLSSELVAWSTKDIVESFCSEVGESFDLRIVIYFRRQDDIIMANYNQLVKSGTQIRPLDRTIKYQMAKFDYEKVLAPWAEAVGRERVVVRPYEKRQFHGNDIRRDFMHHVFGLELTDEFEMPSGNKNPRFSPAAMEYKLQLNRLFEGSEQSARFNDILMAYSAEFDTSTQSVFSSQALLSPADRNFILEQSSEINQMIAGDYLNREDRSLFYDPLPDTAEPWFKPTLSAEEATAITQYIAYCDKKLVKLLFSSGERWVGFYEFLSAGSGDAAAAQPAGGTA